MPSPPADMPTIYTVEEYGERRLEFYEDGAVRFTDRYEEITEITFFVEI
jgi:hypothetical protein